MQSEKTSKTNKTYKNGKKGTRNSNDVATAAAAVVVVATKMETFAGNTECRLKLIWDALHIQYPC